MMVGTFYIYASVTENFHFSNMRVFALIGWGLPLILLLANSSVFVKRYELDPELCWLRTVKTDRTFSTITHF